MKQVNELTTEELRRLLKLREEQDAILGLESPGTIRYVRGFEETMDALEGKGKPAIGCDGTECNNSSHKDWCWQRKAHNNYAYYCCLHTGHKGPHAACGMTHNLIVWHRNGRIIKITP